MKPTPSLPSELADLVPAAINKLCAVVECGAVKASDVLATWDQGLFEFLPLVNVRHRASSVSSERPLISWHGREYDAETSLLFINVVQQAFRNWVRDGGPDSTSAQGAGASSSPTDRTPRRAADAVTIQRPDDPSFDGLRVTSDVLNLFFRIILLYHKDKPVPESQRATRVDTKIILDNIFRFDHSWEPPDHTKVKQELRPVVQAQLQRPELSYSFELAPAVKVLKDWRKQNKMKLAVALRKISEEVFHILSSRAGGDDLIAESVAVGELICEFYGLDDETTVRVRTWGALLAKIEEVASAKASGQIKLQQYYDLGRMQFYFGRYADALASFQTALNGAPEQPDYLLTLGLAWHYLDEYEDACKAYKHSLASRYAERSKKGKVGAKPDEVEEAKISLLMLLTDKAQNRVSLDGHQMPKGADCHESGGDKP